MINPRLITRSQTFLPSSINQSSAHASPVEDDKFRPIERRGSTATDGSTDGKRKKKQRRSSQDKNAKNAFSRSRTYGTHTATIRVMNSPTNAKDAAWLGSAATKFAAKINEFTKPQYETSDIAMALRGKKSIFFSIDDDLISLRNEKHLIACFQSDPHWKSDPKPLHNRRFLEVYFANNLSWKRLIILLMMFKVCILSECC